jgi:hypothetical protein
MLEVAIGKIFLISTGFSGCFANSSNNMIFVSSEKNMALGKYSPPPHQVKWSRLPDFPP